MSAIEGSYGIMYAKGPEGFDHPDLPALTLANSTLNASESYLWKSIRGSGLAYGAGVEIDTESGLVGFSIYRVRLLFTSRTRLKLTIRVQTLSSLIRREERSCRVWSTVRYVPDASSVHRLMTRSS
jgi:hypothetical protein